MKLVMVLESYYEWCAIRALRSSLRRDQLKHDDRRASESVTRTLGGASDPGRRKVPVGVGMGPNLGQPDWHIQVRTYYDSQQLDARTHSLFR
jgi:hypothetical protein